MAGAKPREQRPQPGEALQRVLEARRGRMSAGDAARLSAALLSLIQQGLIVPEAESTGPRHTGRMTQSGAFKSSSPNFGHLSIHNNCASHQV